MLFQRGSHNGSNMGSRMHSYPIDNRTERVAAEIDIVFSDFDVVEPGVVFFERGRESLIDLRKAIRVAPDIAIEVLLAEHGQD